MRALVIGVLVAIAVAAVVWLVSNGHVFFLPLVLLLPFGFTFGRRRSS
jgi:hypothetical protein